MLRKRCAEDAGHETCAGNCSRAVVDGAG